MLASPERAGPQREPVVSPVFLLAPPRSFTSIACAMLGQHPEMYGLPELHLFLFESLSEWWKNTNAASFHMRDGLLRTVAQLYFGGQAPRTIEYSLGWLRRRGHWTCGFLFEELAAKVSPKRLVEKSPSLVYRPEFMQRALECFPQARWIHLTRHPAGQGESVVKALRKVERHGSAPFWLLNLASYPCAPTDPQTEIEARCMGFDLSSAAVAPFDLDPQRAWYQLNKNIIEFLKSVPAANQLRVRGEDIVKSPDHTLGTVATWLGIRSDQEALDQMKHPERSTYAFFGPEKALLGNDGDFLANPRLAPQRVKRHSLSDPLSWASDKRGFSAQVQEMACEFGYQ